MNIDFLLFSAIFERINSLPLLSFFASFFAHYLIYALFFFIIIYIFFKKKDFKQKVFLFLSTAFVILVSRYVFIFILRYIMGEKKGPFEVLSLNNSFDGVVYAFISSSVALSLAMALLFWNISKKLSVVFIVGAVLIGISEVGIGIKWPSDILFGLIVGFVSFLVYKKFFNAKYIINSTFSDSILKENS